MWCVASSCALKGKRNVFTRLPLSCWLGIMMRHSTWTEWWYRRNCLWTTFEHNLSSCVWGGLYYYKYYMYLSLYPINSGRDEVEQVLWETKILHYSEHGVEDNLLSLSLLWAILDSSLFWMRIQATPPPCLHITWFTWGPRRLIVT